MKKIINILFISILALTTVQSIFAETQEQREGYSLENEVGRYLESHADIVIKNQTSAIRIAKSLINNHYTNKTILIKGGSGVSKYSTRAFAREFIQKFRYAPDFIVMRAKNILIVDPKRSGITTTKQIKAFNELAKILEAKGLTVKRIIICKRICAKLPSGWKGSTLQNFSTEGVE